MPDGSSWSARAWTLEPIQESALAVELEFARFHLERQVSVGLNADHRLEKFVVVELKSGQGIDPVFEAQVLAYQRLTKLIVGLPIYFNSCLRHHGIKRFVP